MPKKKKQPCTLSNQFEIKKTLLIAGYGIIISLLLMPSYWLFNAAQPFAHFLFIGLLIGLVSSASYLLVAGLLTSLLTSFILYPIVFNFEHYREMLSIQDRLFYGDVVRSYYVDLLGDFVLKSEFLKLGFAGTVFLGLVVTFLSGFLVLFIKDKVVHAYKSLEKKQKLIRAISSSLLAAVLLFTFVFTGLSPKQFLLSNSYTV